MNKLLLLSLLSTFLSIGCAQTKTPVLGSHANADSPEYVGSPLVLGNESAASLFAKYPAREPDQSIRAQLAAILADSGRTLRWSASATQEYYQNGKLKIPAVIRVPPQCEQNLCPVIVEVYGTNCFSDHYHWRPEFFMRAGYIVVQPNIRGSSCFGNAWKTAAQGRKKLEALTDVDACGKWAKQRFVKNGQFPKIGVMGWSYGGFVALVAMTRFSGTFDAGFALAAKTDLYSFFKNAPEKLRKDRSIEYGDVDKNSQLFRALSPITYVDQVRGPIAMILGGKDPKVSLSDADDFIKKLRDRNQDASLMIVPGQGHLTETPNEITFEHAHIIQFFSEKFNYPTVFQ